ncbi:MAG: DegT/DnrJ/EryC1/StrS family aminotransferase, partial [Methanomicrobiales archaeon]|nr:DegT/DnrJ/EryC1/StrS family aminotransferase [Methanomicrobiales archaeon]
MTLYQAGRPCMLARSRSHVEFASLVKTLAEHDPQDDNVLQQFEEAFARYNGVYRSFAMNQARAGLVVGLKALGIGPGDEILVQSFTFQGVVDAILNTGASAVLVNNSLEDLNSDTMDLERKISPRTKAIIATHLFGVPSDLSGIRTIAQRHEIPIIEDCAQCLGGMYEGKKVGTHGAMAICSFNYEKHLSTGEGGMLMVNTPELAQRTEEVLSSYRRMPLFNDACYAYGLLIMHIMTGSNLYRYGLSAYFGQNLCRTDPQFFATMERLVREEAPEAAFTAAVRSQV